MLPDPLRLLMVAYAEGELSPRRRRAAERLLKHSPEARRLLAGLRSDAELLSELPVRSAPRGLEDRILRRIPGAAPASRPAVPRPRRWPLVVSTFVAASVVLSVTVAAWSMLMMAKHNLPSEPMAVHVDTPNERIDSPAVDRKPSEPDRKPSPRVSRPTRKPAPTQVASKAPAKPEPAPSAGSELASPAREMPELAPLLLPRLPEVFSIPSLKDAAANEKLVGELARADAHRMDLFCRDSGKALDRLQAALKQLGVRALMDAAITDAQKRRTRAFVVFTGDLNAAEWGRLLQIVGTLDQKAEEKKPGDGVLEQLVLMPLGPSDQRDLQSLMGHDPLQPAAKPAEHDPRRPVSDDTADEVAKSIRKSEAGRGARMSLAMAAGPLRTSPAISQEVRQFLESRRPHVPGTVSVMVVIRLAG